MSKGFPAPFGITCYLFSDLPAWEKEGVLPLFNELANRYPVTVVEVRESHRNALRRQTADNVSWIVSKDWSKALSFLGADKSPSRVFVSLFGIPAEKRALPLLFWKRLHRSLKSHIHLIAHSPLNYRFYREIESFPEDRVSFLHLPFSTDLASRFSKRFVPPSDGLRIGTYAPFTSTSNLNYFLNVAHYVLQRKPQARFRIFGFGELYPHLSKMVRELALEDHVTVVETMTADEISNLDVLLFTPIRNDHFLPLLTAAAARLSVCASEVPGVSDLIENGVNGFIFSNHDTAAMGDAALNLLDHTILRRSISDQFQKSIREKFSVEKLTDVYAALLLGSAAANRRDVAKAA
jgi:glycosyltransferase involved in cell wall biosynthesis